MSPEGEQRFEDTGTTLWIRHYHLGTKVVTPEMWTQMEKMERHFHFFHQSD